MTETRAEYARTKLALDMLGAVADSRDVILLPEQARAVLAEQHRLLVELDGERGRSAWTSTALERTLQARDWLAIRAQWVRDLHRAATAEAGLPASAGPRCVTCKEPAPCATVRALDGEQPS